MGVHDVGVSRVGWQRRLLLAGRAGAAPSMADLPHLGLPFLSGRAGGADDVRAEAGSHGGLACSAWSGSSQAHRDQAHPEVAYLDQHSVQRWLIGQRPGDDGLAALAGDLETLEAGCPALVEDSLDADLVARWRLRAAHARPPPDGRTFCCVAGGLLVALAVPFLNWQRFRAAMCSALWVWVCDLHAMKAGPAGRHPKVPLGVESSMAV